MSERTIDTNAKAAPRDEAATKTEFKLPELLAPVGGRRQLVAAVNNGADAVYMGGSLFNARMKAENFVVGGGCDGDGDGRNDDLKWAIDYAHSWGVKVYITLNTLIKEGELARAFEYACSLYELGADAVILQDMGLANLIHKYLPDFPMHLSTQGTLYNRSGVEMAADMGFTRVVPARECTLEEIRSMCEGPTEIEVFVHGALCMCYSGQCQMSRLLGAGSKSDGGGSARSGNRGLCAQPCRLQYRNDKGQPGYMLSPKDICTLDVLPQLCRAGVNSFKIEGRLKSPEYVAVVTRTYRKYLDLYAKADRKSRENFAKNPDAWRRLVEDNDRRMLLQIFNRGGFTEGYLHGNPGKKILSGNSPKNQGIPVGKIVAVREVKTGRKDRSRTGEKSDDRKTENRWLADVKMFSGEIVSMGDGVELEQCGNVVTFVEKISGDVLRIGDFKTDKNERINIGEILYKVTDKKLGENALAMSPVRKNKVDMLFTGKVGSPAKLKLTVDEKSYEAAADSIIEKAIKKPVDYERIREQMTKLGDTPFEAGEVKIEVDRDAMIPVSVINGLRRQAVNMVLTDRLTRRGKVSADILEEAEKEIANSVRKHAAEENNFMKGKILVPLELFMKNQSSKQDEIPYILNVSKGNLDAYIEEHFQEIVEAAEHTGIAIGNLGWIREFQKADVKVYGDYGLNVYNSRAGAAFAQAGVDVIEWSDEMSDRRCLRKPEWMKRIPLMITEHPVESEYLTDRKGVKHDVIKWYSGDKFLIF